MTNEANVSIWVSKIEKWIMVGKKN